MTESMLMSESDSNYDVDFPTQLRLFPFHLWYDAASNYTKYRVRRTVPLRRLEPQLWHL